MNDKYYFKYIKMNNGILARSGLSMYLGTIIAEKLK